MTLFMDVSGFALKLLIVVVVCSLPLLLLLRASRSSSPNTPEPIEIRGINSQMRDRSEHIRLAIAPRARQKALRKAQRRQRKDEERAPSGQADRPRAFVLDFEGDIRASAVGALRNEITALLNVAESSDEIIVRLESPGGMVHSYGLAASQLARIRKRGIRLTVVVDKVAASGGYMMACVADRIVAAPFAIIGSIGVVLQLPNFNRLLKSKDVDFELLTAGDHKRTLTVFGENTEPARAKALEELEETHDLFKSFIVEHRPQLEIDRVANGEHWFGTRALELKLIDEILTSDDYIMQRMETHDIFALHQHRAKPLMQRLAERFASRLRALAATTFQR